MKSLGAAFVILHSLMLVFFGLAVLVQYNDPDPWQWVAFYGISVVTTAQSLWWPDRLSPTWLWGLGAAAAVYAFFEAFFFFTGQLSVEPREFYSELGGLGIVFAWNYVLAARCLRRRPPEDYGSPRTT